MEPSEHGVGFMMRARTPEVVERWARLAEDMEAAPFVHPGWIQAWSDAFGRDVTVATVERDGDLVALMPVVVAGDGVSTATDWHVPFTEAIAVDSPALVSLFKGIEESFKRISADFLLAGSMTELIGSIVLERRPHRRLIRQRSPYVNTAGNWDEYIGSRSTKKLRELRRRRRRLAEDLGRVTYAKFDAASDWASALDIGFEIEASGWKGEAGTALISDSATERCYRDLAAWAASRKLLEIGILSAGDRAIAFDLSLCDGRSVWLLKTGFAHDLGSYAPGMQIRFDAIADVFKRGLDSYEFTGDAEPWKDEWTELTRPVVLIDAFRPGRIGQAELLAARMARAIRVRSRSRSAGGN